MGDLTVGSQPLAADTTLVNVAGEVTFANAQLLARALQDGGPKLVIDLTDVDFIDSSGLAALLAASARARERGGAVALVHGAEPPSIFRFRGVERLLALYGSRDAALAGVR